MRFIDDVERPFEALEEIASAAAVHMHVDERGDKVALGVIRPAFSIRDGPW